MKRLQNYQKSICGFKRSLYTVIKNQTTKKYCYYLNILKSDYEGDVLIFKSINKSVFLNKFTLPVLGFIYNIYAFLLKLPIALIYFPFSMYFDGCKNFIHDRAWQNNVRFFNWSNIVIIIVLSCLLVLN